MAGVPIMPPVEPHPLLVAAALLQQMGGAAYISHSDLNQAQYKSITMYKDENHPDQLLFKLKDRRDES